MHMFNILKDIATRPAPYSAYTAEKMWNDPHVSASMLEFHLSQESELASRPLEFIERSVEWIDNLVGLDGTRVCDFGCGPGLYANRFALRGARVTALDFSRRSIDHARKAAAEQKLAVDYRHQNYLEFQPDGEYDLITMIYGDFCALSPDQRAHLLAIWRKSLATGGSVLMDVFSTEHLAEITQGTEFSHNQSGFWSPDEHFEFRATFRYDDQDLAQDLALFRHVIVQQHRTLDIFNWMQYYTLETLEKELSENSFSITSRYADLTGSSPAEGDKVIAVRLTATV